MSTDKYLYLKETSSTNTLLKELVQGQYLKEGFTIYTDYQDRGRGQRGNSWESNRSENLLFSTILYPNHIKAVSQFLISQIVSLAIKKVLDMYISDASIKWPNDIYWHDKKIAGILIENSLLGDNINYSIIGVGLNVNQMRFLSNAPNPVSMQQITGQVHDINIILNQILDQITEFYTQGQVENIKKQYKESLYRKDGFFQYSDGKEIFRAQIRDIENSGSLVLEQENHTVRKFAFKEVQFIL